jgi:hypothetical protein
LVDSAVTFSVENINSLHWMLIGAIKIASGPGPISTLQSGASISGMIRHFNAVWRAV